MLEKRKVRKLLSKVGCIEKSIIYIEVEGFFTIQTDVVVVQQGIPKNIHFKTKTNTYHYSHIFYVSDITPICLFINILSSY